MTWVECHNLAVEDCKCGIASFHYEGPPHVVCNYVCKPGKWPDCGETEEQ